MPKLAHFRAKHDAQAPTAADSSANILHIDMDAFFVSVELLARPDLVGLAVIVGGQRDQRGVVTSASYEARRFGVHSAMALRTAAKLCPHAVFLDGHHELYGQWSDRVASVLAKYSPTVEMASIDEAYLDLAGTERLHGPSLGAAHKLLLEITGSTGLPCSGGLGATRLVAKVASEQAKPRGLVWIPPGSEAAFLAPLSVRRIPGIGKVTEASLKSLGVETIAQLQSVPLERLEEVFGKWGQALYRKARGIDSYEFFVDAEAKSLSHNQTFGEDTNDREILESTLSHLCQKASKRLRDAGLHARTVSVTASLYEFYDHHSQPNACGTVRLGFDLFAHDSGPLFARLGRRCKIAAGRRGILVIFRGLRPNGTSRPRTPRKTGTLGPYNGRSSRSVWILESTVGRLA